MSDQEPSPAPPDRPTPTPAAPPPTQGNTPPANQTNLVGAFSNDPPAGKTIIRRIGR